MLGEVGDDATVINEDKKAVAEAITAEAAKKQDMTAWKQQQKTEQHLYSWDMELPIQQM